jgi:hypothetical protein
MQHSAVMLPVGGVTLPRRESPTMSPNPDRRLGLPRVWLRDVLDRNPNARGGAIVFAAAISVVIGIAMRLITVS